jgi:hypothetical protein
MTTETVIGLTAMSIYTILAGIALIAAGATYFITRRLSGLTEKLNNTVKNLDKLDDRIKYIEQLNMQESQHVVHNLLVEMKKHMASTKEEERSDTK